MPSQPREYRRGEPATSTELPDVEAPAAPGRGRLRIFRGWWIVLSSYLTQVASGGASGWVFGVLILPMQDELGWSRSTIVGVLTLEKLVAGFGTLLGLATIISTVTAASAPLLVAIAYDTTGRFTPIFTAWGVCCLLAGVGFLFSKPKALVAKS